MDTSKEYIKMCDCDEVQHNTVVDSNNFYVNLGSPPSLEEAGRRGNPYNIILWLPRQDQIQEMLGYPMLYSLRMLYMRFHPGFEPDSFEQLWLAFYIYSIYDKKWNGKKWRSK